jgi:hypothetical protein
MLSAHNPSPFSESATQPKKSHLNDEESRTSFEWPDAKELFRQVNPGAE